MLPQRQRLRELEAHESAVQGPSRSGLERLRLSWGSRRRTEGQAQRDVSTWALYEGKAIEERRFLRELLQQSRQSLSLL